jgi:hypothetical protein
VGNATRLYSIRFIGRRVGALGVRDEFEQMLFANSDDEALLKLYDRFEHIHVLSIASTPAFQSGVGYGGES